MADDSQIDEQNNGFEDGSEQKPSLNKANKNQKIAVAGLAVFAVLIVILWSVQLKNSIYGPLNGMTNTANPADSALTNDQTASDLALKNKDTDGDGLSDYDEKYVYNTSPYIADYDSDGIPDGVEVKNGTDPNCPTGRICSGSGFNDQSASSSVPTLSTDTLNNLSSQSAALNDILNQFNAANPTGVPATPPAADSGAGSLTAEQKQALKNIDVASLRQLLLQNGMDKATLDQISDTELMQSYNETLQ